MPRSGQITGKQGRDNFIIVDLWFPKYGPQDDADKFVKIQIAEVYLQNFGFSMGG